MVVLETAFPEVRRLKAIGAVLFSLSAVFALLPTIMAGEGFSTTRGVTSLVLAVGGAAAGIAGLASPTVRRSSMFLGPGLLLAAVAVNPVGTSLDTVPGIELVSALAFAAAWLLAVEHLHAVSRFVELGSYIARQRITSFRLSSVVNHFQVYGAGMAALILMVTAIVVVAVPWAFAQGSNQVFGRSAELASVFGIGISAAVVFTIAGMILVFIRTVMPQRVEVQSVAYSRDRLEDMLRGSLVLETAREEVPGRRSVDETPHQGSGP
jgi:hypothetical protein